MLQRNPDLPHNNEGIENIAIELLDLIEKYIQISKDKESKDLWNEKEKIGFNLSKQPEPNESNFIASVRLLYKPKGANSIPIKSTSYVIASSDTGIAIHKYENALKNDSKSIARGFNIQDEMAQIKERMRELNSQEASQSLERMLGMTKVTYKEIQELIELIKQSKPYNR